MTPDNNDLGKTVLFKDISSDKYKLFIDLLSFENNEFLKILDNAVDENTMLQLLDIFAGESIKFPTRKSIIWLLDKVNMYTYIKKHDFSDEAYYTMSKQYDRTVYEIKKIISVIQKNLNK